MDLRKVEFALAATCWARQIPCNANLGEREGEKAVPVFQAAAVQGEKNVNFKRDAMSPASHTLNISAR